MSALSHLECSNCHERYDADELHNLCPACGKVLFARYDFDKARPTLTRDSLAERPHNLWRYHELLPVRDPAFQLTLGEGGTPLLETDALGKKLGLNRLLVKDEGRNPTGSFKARGLCAAVSRAVELGVGDLALPTAGNAGAALAAYAARASKTATVAMPVDTPAAIQAECRVHGARVLLVDGLINDAAKVIRAGAETFCWFDVSTLKEPYRVEGKKTMGFEVVEQLGWRVPDAIIFPTGGGTGIVGMWKAFAELEALSLIDGKRPKMFVVQSEGCAPLVRAFEEGAVAAQPWQNAATSAPGIRVPVAVGDYLILQAIRESGGAAIAVSDEDLMDAVALTASLEGMFVSPESGAAVTGARKLRQMGLLDPDELTVVFATGSGLMHTELIAQNDEAIDPNAPDLVAAIEAALIPTNPSFAG
jgi:threonine synthase